VDIDGTDPGIRWTSFVVLTNAAAFAALGRSPCI